MKGPQVGIMIISVWGTYVWFWIDLKYDTYSVHGYLIVECTWCTHFSTQIEDQDQTQDENEV